MTHRSPRLPDPPTLGFIGLGAMGGRFARNLVRAGYRQEAREAGFELPLTERLYAYLDHGERVVIDDNRPAPAFFRQLSLRGPR